MEKKEKNRLFFAVFRAINLKYSRYIYRLKSINAQKLCANIFSKKENKIIELPLHSIFAHKQIISNISPSDASQIGFYCALLESFDSYTSGKVVSLSQYFYLTNGKYNIVSISRDKKLQVQDKTHKLVASNVPDEIYRNSNLLNKFHPSQALYIGYLCGEEVRNKQARINKN